MLPGRDKRTNKQTTNNGRQGYSANGSQRLSFAKRLHIFCIRFTKEKRYHGPPDCIFTLASGSLNTDRRFRNSLVLYLKGSSSVKPTINFTLRLTLNMMAHLQNLLNQHSSPVLSISSGFFMYSAFNQLQSITLKLTLMSRQVGYIKHIDHLFQSPEEPPRRWRHF